MGDGYNSLFNIDIDPLQKKYNKLKQLHTACSLDLKQYRNQNDQLQSLI